MTLEELSFLKSQGFSETKTPGLLFSKTLKVWFSTTKERLSRQYLGFSPTWGISLNGRYLTARTLDFPKVEKGYSLLVDILEISVDERYFLSQTSQERILKSLRKEPDKPTERMEFEEQVQHSPQAVGETMSLR